MPADPFIVTPREEKIFCGILSTAEMGMLKLATGTFYDERAAFLVIDQPGIGLTPVAILVREADLPHMRNSRLDPLRPRSDPTPASIES